ncbi:AraC-like DNA-binding protein [Flagellimonas meridianipacifica]|uniref:AraC-like DNA-binding protein n=2 Tax=Flagellimonas meridianipacifica TaxID=1080225 RepID=A0A2T0MBM5_9FLAO|nr:AraC-like DNA-binding protein [Allomuricauda pacifica]
MDVFNTNTLVNEQTGNLAFKLSNFEDNSQFDHIQRLNYYSIVWIREGRGKAKIDMVEYNFEPDTLFALTPYQPFMFIEEVPLKGTVLNFHPDFFCIHKHHQQVACNGVLFNNIYNSPFLKVDEMAKREFDGLFEQMYNGINTAGMAQYELLVSYLKIFLISASRIKAKQQPEVTDSVEEDEGPFVLQKLKNLIEQYFKSKHSAGDYAEMLNISPKALAKIAKSHFNKTMTNLISERIIIEAKRELYLTDKSVKQIAYELGYEDEYYFSRFFKNNVDISPKFYRDTVGFARANA